MTSPAPHDPTGAARAGTTPAAPGARPRRAVPRTVAAVLGVVVLLAVLAGVGLALAGRDAPGAAPTPPATASPSTSPTRTPEPEPSPVPPEPQPSTLPLRPLTVRFDGTSTEPVVSATPASDATLEDGDYAGYLLGVTAGEAPSVTIDVVLLYAGDAVARQMAEDGELEGAPFVPPLLLVNEVERPRTVPVAPDVAVATTCRTQEDAASPLGVRQRSFPEWAAASEGPVSCTDRGAVPRQEGTLYWFDVRGGTVRQIVGQYAS